MTDLEKLKKRVENCVKRITKDVSSLEKSILILFDEVEERGALIDILARQVEELEEIKCER